MRASTEGPLLVVDSLKLPAEEKNKLLHAIFVENPKSMAKLSAGHKTLAESMKPKFAPLEKYYMGVGGNWGPTIQARMVSDRLQPGHPRELLADVVPHQHAAAGQQRQPDHGLRRDHHDRVGPPGAQGAAHAGLAS